MSALLTHAHTPDGWKDLCTGKTTLTLPQKAVVSASDFNKSVVQHDAIMSALTHVTQYEQVRK